MDERKDQAIARYQAALHAMQTGVAYVMERAPSATTPKHLRVGVNNALLTVAAVAKLLIARNVFTELEYLEALADEAEAEQARYTEQVRELYGFQDITLA